MRGSFQADHDILVDTDPARRLSPIGGEFRDASMERTYIGDQARETRRHAMLLLAASAIINALFLFSDWRFAGTPHFWVAVPARLAVVAASLLCLAAIHRWHSPKTLERAFIAWMAVTGLGVSLLVTSHSTLALFVLMMLPSIFYLVVPVRFRLALGFGLVSSAGLLAGFQTRHGSPIETLGLGLALVMLNVALTIILSRANRLGRLAWLSTGQERAAKEAAAQTHTLIEQLFAASPVPMVVTDPCDGTILRSNATWFDLIGAAEKDLAGRTMHSFFAKANDRERLLRLLDRNGAIDGIEVEIKRTDGALRTVILRAKLIQHAEGKLVVSALSDISARKSTELALERLASTDMLTGLPNRHSFFTLATTEIARARRSGSDLALLMVDLDNFKAINDGYGHQCGDEVLRTFANICRSSINRGDIVGRLGGEEFAVLIPAAGATRARSTAERLRQAVADIRLGEPYAALRVTTSIGLTQVHAGDATIDSAIGRADAALYAAKRGGRNRVETVDEPPLPEAGRAA